MKRLKKLLFTQIVFLTMLSFLSSCGEDDSYWISTTLDFETDIPVMVNGDINVILRIYDTHLADFQPNRNRLLNTRCKNSWLTISNMMRHDQVYLRLLTGDVMYEYSGVIRPDANGAFIIHDYQLRNFMADAMDIIEDYGYVDIEVQGTSNVYDGGPLFFRFENDAEILLRDL